MASGVQLAFHIFILEASHLLADYFRPKGEQKRVSERSDETLASDPEGRVKKLLFLNSSTPTSLFFFPHS